MERADSHAVHHVLHGVGDEDAVDVERVGGLVFCIGMSVGYDGRLRATDCRRLSAEELGLLCCELVIC